MEYVQVHVHDDGDTELTRVNLSEQAFEETSMTERLFGLEDIKNGAFTQELISYGIEEQEVAEALAYILTAEFNEPCIVGKL